MATVDIYRIIGHFDVHSLGGLKQIVDQLVDTYQYNKIDPCTVLIDKTMQLQVLEHKVNTESVYDIALGTKAHVVDMSYR